MEISGEFGLYSQGNGDLVVLVRNTYGCRKLDHQWLKQIEVYFYFSCWKEACSKFHAA